MTTIIATEDGIWGDTLISFNPAFTSEKLFRIGSSIYGVAGNFANCIRFINYRTDGKLPKFSKDEFDALELNDDGLFLWTSELVPMKINDEYYAIGSGASFALGALDMGADPDVAIRIASKRNPETNSKIDCLMLYPVEEI